MAMDVIQLSNKLQATGLERKSAEAIAQAIDEHNNEIVTKADIKSLKELFYFSIAAGGAALGYIITKI